MSASARFHARLPFSGAGVVEITVNVSDAEAMAPADQDFIVAVLGKVTAFAEHVWPAEAAKPEVPAVLRGVSRA